MGHSRTKHLSQPLWYYSLKTYYICSFKLLYYSSELLDEWILSSSIYLQARSQKGQWGFKNKLILHILKTCLFQLSHFSTNIETFNIAEKLNLVWSDATTSLCFPRHTSEHVPPQNSSQYSSICYPPHLPFLLYSCKPVTDQLTTKRLYNLPKLLFFCKTTLQQYFVENTRD